MKTAKLRISFPMNGDGHFYIAVTDDDSRIEFVEVRVAAADFARAIACHQVDCEFETRGLDRLGTRREHKTEVVPVPDHDFLGREKAARKAIAPFEVDGWIGRWEDAVNPHNRDRKTNTYRVSFERWVPIPEPSR